MSLYPFSASETTKAADREPLRAAITTGQLLRTLGIFVAFVIALGFVVRQSHVANDDALRPGFTRSIEASDQDRGA